MWISRNFCGVAAIEIPAFSIFKKGAYLSAPFSSRSPVLGGRLFCFLRTLSSASKRALEEMEVKIEESEQWKFQTKTNQTGIPFPYRPSHSDGEAHLYRVPIVRGMPLSRPRLSLSGRGRGMYWKGSLSWLIMETGESHSRESSTSEMEPKYQFVLADYWRRGRSIVHLPCSLRKFRTNRFWS